MVVDRSHGISGSEKGLYYTTRSMDFHIHIGSSCPSSPMIVIQNRSGRCLWSNFVSQPGNHSFYNLLHASCKQTFLTFALGETIFITLDSKQTFPLFWRKTLSISSKAIRYENIFEKLVDKRIVTAPAHKTWRSSRDPWRIVSQPVSQKGPWVSSDSKTHLNLFILGVSAVLTVP